MLALTALYVPGDRPDRFDSAERSGADAVVLDLEDAVDPAHKAAARENVLAWLARPHACRTEVRVNADLAGRTADLAALRGLDRGPDVVRLPKVQSPDDVRDVVPLLPPGSSLTCVLESARALEAAYDVARAHERVAALGLGEADLAGDLGVEGEEGLAWARSRVLVAARAAGLPAPMMSVYPRLDDDEGLAASCAAGRRLGLVGRSVVHPRQVPVVVAAFTPDPAEVERARQTLAELAGQAAAEVGVRALPDGRMVDRAMAGRARTTLAVQAAVDRYLARSG